MMAWNRPGRIFIGCIELEPNAVTTVNRYSRWIFERKDDKRNKESVKRIQAY